MMSEFEQWQQELAGVKSPNVWPLILMAAAMFSLGVWGYLTFLAPGAVS